LKPCKLLNRRIAVHHQCARVYAMQLYNYKN